MPCEEQAERLWETDFQSTADLCIFTVTKTIQNYHEQENLRRGKPVSRIYSSLAVSLTVLAVF
jgi:hypothetical protein